MMGIDDRSSTASTVSDVFKTVLQSPAPICMFYLSHPFGVVSPASIEGKDAFKFGTSSSPCRVDQMVSVNNDASFGCDDDAVQRRQRKLRGDVSRMVGGRNADIWESNFVGCNHARTTSRSREDDSRLRSGHLVPWPRDTWRREFVLPPLIQFRGEQKDQTTAPDLEVILRTIRQAWNSPHCRSNLHSRSYEDTDIPTGEWNISNRNFAISKLKLQRKSDINKMGSGNNSTPVISGLLRRRYSVPEIIMRKHSLAQQKSYEESLAATAPSPHRSAANGVYHKSFSTNTPNRSYPISSGSDSNLSVRRFERGEMSMRKSTLLRRIWSKELKRYDDTRSGSWSPPMRRSQRRLHPEPVEMHRCEECRKLEDDNDDESEELLVGASRKRLRLVSQHGKEVLDGSIASYHNSSSSNYTRSTSDRIQQISTVNNSSLESTPSLPTTVTTTTTNSLTTNPRSNNVHIYMTPINSDQSTSESVDQGQDMLRVEIDLDNSETNGNSIHQIHEKISSDENQNEKPTLNTSTTTPTRPSKNANGDSPLDRFISKLLIDNLADLADEINEQFENNNNLMRNTSTPKSKRVSSVYLSPKHIAAVVCKNLNSDLTSTDITDSICPTSDTNNQSKTTESSNNEHIIYFPSYSLECKDDMSSYTSNCSDLELSSIPAESLITVNVGSTYPQSEHPEILAVPRRLHKLPRTESLEAQHSLTSALGEHEEDDNAIDTDTDSVSLVDSLEEPHTNSNSNQISIEKAEKCENLKTEMNEVGEEEEEEENVLSICREPEAFFVHITEGESPEVQTATVADAMPEKLKAKIMQRQRELDKRRDEERKEKQKKAEVLMDPKLEEENFCEKSPMRMKKESPVKEKIGVTKKSETTLKKQQTKSSATVLRNEIGLLESYTIDSKGNMQMRAVQQKTETSSTGTMTAASSSRRMNLNRGSIQRKQSVVAPKVAEVVQVTCEPKKQATSTSHVKSKPKYTTKRDIQKMTIFQAQSDIITPDSENGPRRVYQKTEIQDGEQHIEILEIVECIESSPECSPNRQHTFRCSSKSALTRRSKIPIPIYKIGRSAGYQKAVRCPLLREASPNSVKCISRNLQVSGCNKIDRVIAELLIDALNRPEEMGIEIIKSPKDLTRDKGSSKRQAGQRRTTPRKSANNAKYQQVFEVIPEEKSSFSVDSSADDTTKVSSKQISGDSTSNNTRSSSEQTSSVTAPTIEIHGISMDSVSTASTNQKSTSGNSGRMAVDHAEPNAWIGFFRRHNDSSMDEEDSPSQQYTSSSKTSAQLTITSPSTNTAAAGTTTPKEVSSADCINSAESDNVLKLIENTFQTNNDPASSVPSNPASTSDYIRESTMTTAATIASGATSTVTSETFSSTCKSCKKVEKQSVQHKSKMLKKDKMPEKRKALPINAVKKSDTVLKLEHKQSIENSSQSSISSLSTTAEASSGSGSGSNDNEMRIEKKDKIGKSCQPADVWRVQSPDICKMAIPKRMGREKSVDEPSLTEITNEIDTKSFIIVEDSCNMSPSRLNCSTNVPLITPTSSINKCTICCFCNPDLHKSSQTTSSTPCPYCNRKRTPPKREEETNTESDYFLNHPFYQSMTKSDHTHIRTRSRDSDVVSTKCTKVNEKIKNYNIPDGSTSHQDTSSKSRSMKNPFRSKNVVNLPPTKLDSVPVHKVVQDTIKKNNTAMKNSTPDRKNFRLPSPYANLSSTSYERTSSPSSSSDSTCPTPPTRCPVLPSTRRHHFTNVRSNSKDKEKRKDKEKVKTVGVNNNESVSDNTNNNTGVSNVKTNGQANGWSVTVAGSYNQDMAPDLEMRLSFPKAAGKDDATQHPQHPQLLQPSHTVNHIITDSRDIHQQRIVNGNSIYADNHYANEDDLVNDNYARSNNLQFRALPPPGNPKRTLTRIVSERTHSQRDINFPEVSPISRNPITSRQMAKKAIKHTECSVAVTSATRTISNFTRGRRTISYHALNTTTESQRTNNNNRDRHIIRDNSLDLGNLSSGRRMSLESQIPSATDYLTLSIMGNAIAPEQKPRVLTMSEKDLTRRHHSCFTRNRAFFT